MNRAERAGSMPVFLGALRARLLLGVDDRILLLVGVTALGGIFSPLLFLLAGALFIAGRIVGAVSPYFFDEVSVYTNWRVFSWGGVVPDDVPDEEKVPRFVRQFKRAKS